MERGTVSMRVALCYDLLRFSLCSGICAMPRVLSGMKGRDECCLSSPPSMYTCTHTPNRPFRCESKLRSFSLEGGRAYLGVVSIRVVWGELHCTANPNLPALVQESSLQWKALPLLLQYSLLPSAEGRQVATRIENPGPQTTRFVVENLRRFQYHDCLSVCTVPLEPLDSATSS